MQEPEAGGGPSTAEGTRVLQAGKMSSGSSTSRESREGAAAPSLVSLWNTGPRPQQEHPRPFALREGPGLMPDLSSGSNPFDGEEGGPASDSYNQMASLYAPAYSGGRRDKGPASGERKAASPLLSPATPLSRISSGSGNWEGELPPLTPFSFPLCRSTAGASGSSPASASATLLQGQSQGHCGSMPRADPPASSPLLGAPAAAAAAAGGGPTAPTSCAYKPSGSMPFGGSRAAAAAAAAAAVAAAAGPTRSKASKPTGFPVPLGLAAGASSTRSPLSTYKPGGVALFAQHTTAPSTATGSSPGAAVVAAAAAKSSGWVPAAPVSKSQGLRYNGVLAAPDASMGSTGSRETHAVTAAAESRGAAQAGSTREGDIPAEELEEEASVESKCLNFSDCERACEEMDREGERVEGISLVPLSAARFAGPRAPQLVLYALHLEGRDAPVLAGDRSSRMLFPKAWQEAGEEWQSKASQAQQQELAMKALQRPVELYKPKLPVKASLEPADDLEAWLFG